MSGMTCTRCQQPAGEAPDLTGLPAKAVIAVTSGWLCDSCLDDDEQDDLMEALP